MLVRCPALGELIELHGGVQWVIFIVDQLLAARRAAGARRAVDAAASAATPHILRTRRAATICAIVQNNTST